MLNIIQELITDFLMNKAVPLGAGNNRASFAYGNSVYKIPICTDGFFGNIFEAELSKKVGLSLIEFTYKGNSHFCRIAPCSLMEVNGIPILKMDKLETIDWKIRRTMFDPDWYLATDDGQGGFDKKGVFRLYDFEILQNYKNKVYGFDELVGRCYELAHKYELDLRYPSVSPTWLIEQKIALIYG